MFELGEAIELAFLDLEESFVCTWRSGLGSKPSLMEAFSQREIPSAKFLGFGGSDGLRHAFGRAIPTNNKPSYQKWEDWILDRIGLRYCRYCTKVHENGIDPVCVEPYIDRSDCREYTSKSICQYLVEHPCSLCGETDIRVLEFDHIDPNTKSYNIGDRSNRSWETTLKEINKCRVLCANCHRIHTAKSQNHFKHQFFTELLNVTA